MNTLLPAHRLRADEVAEGKNIMPLPHGALRRRWGSKMVDTEGLSPYTSIYPLDTIMCLFAGTTFYRLGVGGTTYYTKAGNALEWATPERGWAATPYGAPTYPAGYFGAGTDFGALSANYVTIPTTWLLAARGTVAFWLYYTDARATAGAALWDTVGAALGEGYMAGVSTATVTFQEMLGGAIATWLHGWSTGWHHLGFVWDEDGIGVGTDTLQIWADGVEVAHGTGGLTAGTRFALLYMGKRGATGQPCGFILDDVFATTQTLSDFSGRTTEGGLC